MSAPRFRVTIGERVVDVVAHADGTFVVDGRPVNPEIRLAAEGLYSVLIDGRSHTLRTATRDEGFAIATGCTTLQVSVESERSRLLKRVAGAGASAETRTAVTAPMPALVVRVLAAPGSAVQKGDGLIVLEAMKMENEIRAPRNGTVREVRVGLGKAVEKGEVLITLE